MTTRRSCLVGLGAAAILPQSAQLDPRRTAPVASFLTADSKSDPLTLEGPAEMGAAVGSLAGDDTPSSTGSRKVVPAGFSPSSSSTHQNTVPLLSWAFGSSREDPELGQEREVDLTRDVITLADLPPMPAREPDYWSEMGLGICVVLSICTVLVGFTWCVQQVAERPKFAASMFRLMCTWAAVSATCTAWIVLGRAGEIRRSEAVCFPLPQEVENRLRRGDSFEKCINVKGPDGDRAHGSYCVRCFLWRPADTNGEFWPSKSHHCSICQRCVRGFDHHCNVFGRCIVDGNLPCFWMNIGMLWAGMITASIAFLGSLGPGPMTDESLELARRMAFAAFSPSG